MLLATEPDWQLPRHLDLIDSLLVKVAAGELKRLIVTVPVRHGKSEMCSRFFPAWHIGMWPHKRVVVAGYGQRFADHWGEQARALLTDYGDRFYGTTVSKSSRSRARWNVEIERGGMFALGVGGPLTGFGADVLVIDDPHKNSEEANSEVSRENVWDWYWGTARTRLEPGGAIVILMARWHEDDLVGRLLNHPVDVEPFTVVNLPAIAEENDILGRQPGEALWPERYGIEELEAIQKAQLSLYWSALYQQRPAPPEGFLFKRKDFRYWRTHTGSEPQTPGVEQTWFLLDDRRFDVSSCVRFQTVDTAMSEKETADYTVVATWCATPDLDLILLDVQRRHFEQQQVASFLAAQNDFHQRPPMWIERFGAGRSPLAMLMREGRPVREIPVEAGTRVDKLTRAFGAIALCERHKMFFPSPGSVDWLTGYEAELVSFPNATHDDMVDVTSYAARLLPMLGLGGGVQREYTGPRPESAGMMSMNF